MEYSSKMAQFANKKIDYSLEIDGEKKETLVPNSLLGIFPY
jgi:hypothetical protein